MSPDKIIIKAKETGEIKKKSIKEWPKVAIIILNWNGWKDTIECLESVFRNNYPNYQVIVIDNGSTDGSIEKIKAWADGKQEVLTPESTHPLYYLSHPPIKKTIPYIYYNREEAEKSGNFELEEKVTKEWQEQRKSDSKEINPTSSYPLILIQTGENLGFAGGNNVGIRYMLQDESVDYILLLNNDTIVEKNFLQQLVQARELAPKVGIVGGKILCYDDTSKVSHSAGFVNWIIAKPFVKEFSESSDCDFVTGACFLIKRGVVKKLNKLLDEDYFLYWEDTDFCLRAKREGFTIHYEPKAVLFHKVSQSSGLQSRCKLALYYYTRNRFLFIRRNGSLLYKLIFFFLYSVVGVPFFIFKSIFIFNKKFNQEEICTYLSAIFDGLFNRFGRKEFCNNGKRHKCL